MSLQLLKSLSTDLPYVNLDLLKLNEDANIQLDLLASMCNDQTFQGYEWGLLAGRVYLQHIKSPTKRGAFPSTFSQSTLALKNNLNSEYMRFVIDNASTLDEIAKRGEDTDLDFDYFAMKTLENSYLACIRADREKTTLEIPSYMYLRIATYLYFPDFSRIERVFDDLRKGNYSHASPTMFNAGMKESALSSCFKLHVDDTMPSIAQNWTTEAIISKNGGGIGKDFSEIRHSEIGQSGFSRGIMPWLKIDNEIMCAVDQSGKRKGSMCVYTRDWNVDVYEFIEARLPLTKGGADEMRARDLFYGLMVSDLFMKRVRDDKIWSLFCPKHARTLVNTYDKDFEIAYESYEREHKYSRQVRARELWELLLNVQMEVGMPFILYIDAINRKCNQTHNGNMVKISNLCTEITGITNSKEIFSCNLASIALNSCVITTNNTNEVSPAFDFEMLGRLSRDLVRNLNMTIDRNHYPDEIPAIKYANFRRRPIGIGVQGLADTFALMDIPWVTEKNTVDPRAEELNIQIFEKIYVEAIKESIELAKEEGSYDTFHGSPASKGLFQFDLWEIERLGVTREHYLNNPSLHYKCKLYTVDEINKLRVAMIKYGLRNSLLTSLMPTASSAHIRGNNESFEPFNQLIFSRSILSGQFLVSNKYFIAEARKLGIWNTELFRYIMNNCGLISGYKVADPELQEKVNKLALKYKGIYEISQRVLLKMSADRGRYICQSQSMNCHMIEPSFAKLNAYHFYGWEQKLKTGMYYLRQERKASAINFALEGIQIDTSVKITKSGKRVVCQEEVCVACST